MSGKGPVLGNDPFERGAADRDAEAPKKKAASPKKKAASPKKKAASPKKKAASPKKKAGSPAEPAGAPPSVQGVPSWIRTAAATADTGQAPARDRARGPVARAMDALAEAAEAPDALTKAVQAAGMGGAAILEVGEEIASELERALTRVLGPTRGAELAGHLADVLALLQRTLSASGASRVGRRPPAYDAFGLDPELEARVAPLLGFIFERWFRAETHGIEHVPSAGRALLVANHAGALPWDALMVKTAVALRHPRSRRVRPLIEDAVFHAPFLGPLMTGLGAVRACPENAEHLLAEGALVGVFPEGVKGMGKPYRHRYQLQRFGRGGFIKLCLRTGTPIVPVAVVGSEEAHPLLFRLGVVGRSLGLPGIPITPTFPLLGPLGLLPLPARWVLEFGEPIDLSPHGPEAAEDRVLVGRLAEQVRGRIQAMVDARVRARRRVFL